MASEADVKHELLFRIDRQYMPFLLTAVKEVWNRRIDISECFVSIWSEINSVGEKFLTVNFSPRIASFHDDDYDINDMNIRMNETGDVVLVYQSK